jgi:uncharacterized protein (DUF58 family)
MEIKEPIREFHYQVAWRTSSPYPGFHPGISAGEGFEFQRHQNLIDNPNPRHLDLHASAQDPFGNFLVRSFKQRGRIPVQVIADLSASMAFKGKRQKLQTLIDFLQSVAWAVSRTGDALAFHACSDTIHWQYHVPLKWYKRPPAQLWEQFTNIKLAGSAQALQDIAAYLGTRPSLVFLVSDFHFELDQLQQILENMSRHDVVPMVIWDENEQLNVANGSYFTIQDAESGKTRSLLMRPALREQITAAFKQHKDDITRLCHQYGRRPFFIEQQFDPDAMTRYFFS